jgi:AIPR protein
MSSNAQTILGGILDRDRVATAPDLDASRFFEIFSAEQILKNYGLSYDEIQGGLVGNGGDGGIDSFYTFVNGILAIEEAEYSGIKQNVVIKLIIIQSKATNGFSEETILKIESTIKDLLDLNLETRAYRQRYNSSLLRAVGIFREAYDALLLTSPELHIVFHYATKGSQVHPDVEAKAENLKEVARHLFTQSNPEFHFVGAEELLGLYHKSKIEKLPLNVLNTLQTTSTSTICLVNLKDFYDFIQDSENGELRSWLFEENLRDYEGKNVDVNRSIRTTLKDPTQGQDFWWLNNGITIVAGEAPLSGKTLVVSNPKIVNGLQTSIEIYNYFHEYPDVEEDRYILVRAIVTNDESTRNDIIVATNKQSAIAPASLRAFDRIHFQIEQYFGLNDLYYDRRKNYYKNQGKPKDQIISVVYLAQAIAAILLQRPNDSRGRPTNLIKTENLYKAVFSDSYPIALYLECLRFMKRVDEFLNSDDAPENVKGHEFNVRYQLAMFASAIKLQELELAPDHIKQYSLVPVDSALLAQCLRHVWEILQSQRGPDKDLDEDRVAKSPELDQELKTRLKEILVDKVKAL